MTWRLLTCFSLLVATLAGATVSGSVAVVSAKGTAVESDLSGVVVWLQPSNETLPLARTSTRQFRIVQQNKQFTPHILAIPVGASVEFPNFDPIFHNAFSNYNGQIFDVGLYPPGSSRTVTFRREGIVRIFCNIHSAMSAVIVALRTPYFTQSKQDGSFELDGVAPGSYRMSFYYERATEQTLTALTRTFELGTEPLVINRVAISEAGYLAMPHLNKYGKRYGSSPDAGTYPGARP